jgi:hypothetical protein
LNALNKLHWLKRQIMSWLKKIIGASILTSLFFIAPETVQAEICGTCGLYNTGGYNLYSFGQNLNTVATACAPTATAVAVPVYLSQPVNYLFASSPSFYTTGASGWGGGCGTFTQSCGSCYDTMGMSGYGSNPGNGLVDIQLLNLISYQGGLLNQLSNPYTSIGTGPVSPYNPYSPIAPSIPFSPYNPYIPYNPLIPNPITSGPTLPGTVTSSNPYDNSIPFPTTPSLSYGGCDNITVMCPQPGIQTYTNTPTGPTIYTPSISGGTPTVSPNSPSYVPTTGSGALPPSRYQVPRGFTTHR